MTDTMRAWQYSSVSGKLEDCLQARDDVPALAGPSLHKGMVLIEVISASINPVDYKLPESGVMGRLIISLPATPGLDFCGRVIATHPSDATYTTGQLVFGGFPMATQHGTLGQQIVISGDCCAPLPAGVNPDDAAAVGTAATTAYQSLVPDSIKKGAHVFINGGSGGVGSWGIQMAKALGAERVVTTCSTRNVELCRQLGADEVVDYKKVNVISTLESRNGAFDLIIDNVGSTSELYENRNKFLKPDGSFVQVGVGEEMSLWGILSIYKRQLSATLVGGPRFYFVNSKSTTKLFTQIGDWMAEGKIKAVIDETFPWEEVPAALRKLREGHAKGKIVIHVAKQLTSSEN